MRGRAAVTIVTASCAATLLTALALGATGAVYDFSGGNGRFTSQVRERGTKFYVRSLTLVCGRHSYVSATPRAAVSRSGAFSYRGAGSLFTGAQSKNTKSKLKVSGKISLAKKTGTAKASATAKGCKSFSGKLKGFLVPVASGG